MTNLKKRIDKIETSLNGGRYATLENIVAEANDLSLPDDPRPLPPELQRFFNELEKRSQPMVSFGGRTIDNKVQGRLP
ncbi:MAG: hypothetical protein ABSF20_00285 [Smithella sp.]|jgi:hypothetical protein